MELANFELLPFLCCYFWDFIVFFLRSCLLCYIDTLRKDGFDF